MEDNRVPVRTVFMMPKRRMREPANTPIKQIDFIRHKVYFCFRNSTSVE